MLEKGITRDIFIERFDDMIHDWLMCELPTIGSEKDMLIEARNIINERTTHLVGRCLTRKKI